MIIRDELDEISKRQKENSAKYNRLKEEFEGKVDEVNKEDSQSYSQLEIIANRLKAGESTGDPLLDFGVVCYKISDEAKLKQLRELHESSRKNVGGLVLVVTQSIAKAEMEFEGERIDMGEVKTKKDLGVLSGEAIFSLPDESLIIPCKKHVYKGADDKFWKLNGAIVIDAWSLRSLGKNLVEIASECTSSIGDAGLFAGSTSNTGLQIYFGEADVEKQFRGNFGGELVEEEALGTDRAIFSHYAALGISLDNYTYYAALKLLGKEASKDFREKYMRYVAPQAASLLEKIRKLECKEEKVARHIKEIESQAINGQYTYSDGEFNRTMPVDRYLSNHKEDLESIRNGIRDCLQEAIDYCILGLGINLDAGKIKPLKVDDELKRYAEAYDFKLAQ